MARLAGTTAAEVMEDRLSCARGFSRARGVILVLKGQRTLIAFPDGRVWINPTGSPAMGTGGTGDILTGLIAGLIAQFPDDIESAVLAAVWIHGRAGEIGALRLGEQGLVATDLLRFLPEAIEDARSLPDRL
jgi:NAD(P)H-hydrate epimerase